MPAIFSSIKHKNTPKMNHQLQNHKNTVGSLASAIDVGAMLSQLHDIVHDAVAEKHEAGTDGRSWLINSYSEIDRETMRIYELIKKKRAENEALLNVPTDEEELKKFIVQIEAGAEAVCNSTKVLDWTEELKSEYTNRFLELNKSLDVIYHRINARNASAKVEGWKIRLVWNSFE